MPGLEDLYREIILDHYRNPRNRGELSSPPATRVEGFNPLCGDEIVVYLDVDGDVVGYIYALKDCVFEPTIMRIRYTVGELPRADRAVAEEYNNTVRDTAVCNFCVIHQRFREEVAKNITIADQMLDCVQLANRGFIGDTKIAEDLLRKIDQSPEYVRSLLRNYACVYAILMRGARLKGEDLDD